MASARTAGGAELARLHRLVSSLLPRLGIASAAVDLVARSHNATFRVRPRAEGGQVSLSVRLYRAPAEETERRIRSEVAVLRHLASAGVAAPRPVADEDGEFVLVARDPEGGPALHALACEWIEGEPLGATQYSLMPERIGAGLARIHKAFDSFVQPSGFARPRWDAEGLRGGVVGADPEAACRTATPEERRLLDRAFRVTAATLDEGGSAQRISTLIHTDPRRENILDRGGELVFIDYDGCGWGTPAYDLATALASAAGEDPDVDLTAYRDCLVRGHRAVCEGPAIAAALVDRLLVSRLAVHLVWYLHSTHDPAFPRQPGFRPHQVRLLERCLRRVERPDTVPSPSARLAGRGGREPVERGTR